jgi:hypothetical protein
MEAAGKLQGERCTKLRCEREIVCVSEREGESESERGSRRGCSARPLDDVRWCGLDLGALRARPSTVVEGACSREGETVG